MLFVTTCELAWSEAFLVGERKVATLSEKKCDRGSIDDLTWIGRHMQRSISGIVDRVNIGAVVDQHSGNFVTLTIV